MNSKQTENGASNKIIKVPERLLGVAAELI